jgi:hypothetical protein
MKPRTLNTPYKLPRIESGWRLDTRVLDVVLADSSDSTIFSAFDISSRMVICSSLHKDGISAWIGVLNRAIRKHGAPSRFICKEPSEFSSLEFEEWALRQNIPIYFVPSGVPQRLRQSG